VEQAKLSQRTTHVEGPSSGTKRKNHTEDNEGSANVGGADRETPQTPATPNQAYNTRYKGFKRVRVGRDIPEGFSYTPQRGRGRPRKLSAPGALESHAVSSRISLFCAAYWY